MLISVEEKEDASDGSLKVDKIHLRLTFHPNGPVRPDTSTGGLLPNGIFSLNIKGCTSPHFTRSPNLNRRLIENR